MYDGGDALKGAGAGIPSFLAVSVASAMVRGCVFCDGRLYLCRVYAKYGTTIWGQHSQIFGQTSPLGLRQVAITMVLKILCVVAKRMVFSRYDTLHVVQYLHHKRGGTLRRGYEFNPYAASLGFYPKLY